MKGVNTKTLNWCIEKLQDVAMYIGYNMLNEIDRPTDRILDNARKDIQKALKALKQINTA